MPEQIGALDRASVLVRQFQLSLFVELTKQVNSGAITSRTAYKFLEDNIQFEYDWEDYADEEGLHG